MPRTRSEDSKTTEAQLRCLKKYYSKNREDVKDYQRLRYFDRKLERWLNEWSSYALR